jgi:hypothetical protein
MSFITVAIVTALCLLVPALRLWGIIGVGTLLYFKSALTLGLLIFVGISYITYRRFLAWKLIATYSMQFR